jgi:hypothetical protein
MNKELKARLDKIPSNWNELNTGDYIKLIQQLNIEDEEDSDVKILSILTDVDEDILNECHKKDMIPYLNRLVFLNSDVPTVKVPFKCKEVSEIKNKDFDLWMKLQAEPLENMNQLLPVFFPELKDVDINKIPYPIVNACFFLLLKKSKQSLRHSQLSLNWKIIVMYLKQKIGMLFKIFRT